MEEIEKLELLPVVLDFGNEHFVYNYDRLDWDRLNEKTLQIKKLKQEIKQYEQEIAALNEKNIKLTTLTQNSNKNYHFLKKRIESEKQRYNDMTSQMARQENELSNLAQLLSERKADGQSSFYQSR